MSGQSALRERAALLEELRQIVQAMKNIAFAELQRVTHLLPVQATACDVLLQALQALPDEAEFPGSVAPQEAPVAWLVIGAERGFCGAFNDRLVSHLEALRRDYPRLRLFVAGQRLGQLLGAQGPDIVVLPGCAALEDADAVLNEWFQALAPEAAHSREIWLLHTGEGDMVRQRVLPLPSNRSEAAANSRAAAPIAPLHYLPLPVLRAALVNQGLRLLLQGGLFSSLKQEHRWRLAQMQRAHDHLDDLGQALRRRHAALRQAEITNEQETLMSSLLGENAPSLSSPLTVGGA